MTHFCIFQSDVVNDITVSRITGIMNLAHLEQISAEKSKIFLFRPKNDNLNYEFILLSFNVTVNQIFIFESLFSYPYNVLVHF